jgi:16S rRNA (guanine527-N7)-methyltransferase
VNGPPLGPQGLAERTGVSRETLERLQAYAALLASWSERINLVGPATLVDPWRRHFLDSAQLLPLIPPAARRVIDLGSGAGFPGLVLAVLGVVGVELIEADRRKEAFLREAVRVTGADVIIRGCRIEAVPTAAADVVTARGCAPLERLLPLAQRFIGPDTQCLFLKGARAEEELTAAGKAWTMTVSRHPSVTDPGGVVLSLRQVMREVRQP